MIVVIGEEFDDHREQVLWHHVKEAGLELLAVHGDVGDLLHKLSPHVGFWKKDSQIIDNKINSYALFLRSNCKLRF